ncbi:MAG: wax ester/triacylglycerol synthase family O-acyltransferase [Actinomycetota bacterium]
MKQLSAQDAMFLHLESSRTPMHIGALSIYDPTSAPGGEVSIDQILARVEDRIGLADAFSQTVAWVPFGLGHPSWVRQAHVDVEFHVRHLALPGPGDWGQLWTQVGRLHSRPLDMGRPLWELTVIEGLGDVAGVPQGAYAVVSKVHHSAIDGVSGQEVTAAVHDLDAAGTLAPEPRAIRPDRPPTDAELVARALAGAARQPWRFAKVTQELIPGVRALFDGAVRGQLDVAASVAAVPRTRFNGVVTPHRTVTGVRFPLEEIKRVKAAVDGATVNDVVLTICGGGLRRYLSAHNELPSVGSLAAMAPISLRSPADSVAGGNRVSAMTVSLHTNAQDDLERLQLIRESTRSSKDLEEAIGTQLKTEYPEFIPAAAAGSASRLAVRLAATGDRPLVSCVITNVPGPQLPLYSVGAELIDMYGTGPVLDGLGLFMPVLSYNGSVTISATSCREMLPDPERLQAGLEESFGSLVASVS